MKNVASLLIAVVIALVLTFLIKVDTDDRIDAIHKENERLELRCDSLKNINDSIKIEMDNYSKKIDSIKSIDKKLSEDYAQNQAQIKTIKQKYENNKRIDNFSTPDIVRYFTDSL
jgi:TolA-binding protein